MYECVFIEGETILKKVRCIDASPGRYRKEESLTLGQIYEVIDEYNNPDDKRESYYSLRGMKQNWLKHRFVVVSCPCNIKNCLAKHEIKE